MFLNRFSEDRSPAFRPVHLTNIPSHEALEVSLCDEGMCFLSEIPHEIGAVLAVNFSENDDFDPELSGAEAIVVDCIPLEHASEGYQITVIFTGN